MNVVLSLGSNLYPRDKRIRAAIEWLGSIMEDMIVSEIYETPELHGLGAPYLNAVLAGVTHLTPDSLNKRLKLYEIEAGRDENARRNGIVPVDIDLVMAGNEELEILRPRDFSHSFFRIGYDEILCTLKTSPDTAHLYGLEFSGAIVEE
ncbi:MAG: 2-amino-4-hydroxy-6-hydroxymethyldihydropteridine diphosphokinase [Candidatus Amulumruptor caecigallinarius]|nr:2-amino-4-hydroxy-6-hydroxymethyldihydropteridine diphosphokinase [Candidatus Amulumruptor caecigallinarius]